MEKLLEELTLQVKSTEVNIFYLRCKIMTKGRRNRLP